MRLDNKLELVISKSKRQIKISYKYDRFFWVLREETDIKKNIVRTLSMLSQERVFSVDEVKP